MMSLSLLTATIASRLKLDQARRRWPCSTAVLITGAGGTIGSALCDAFHGGLIGIDRDGSKLAASSAYRQFPIDVLDCKSVGLSPSIVIHCAAAKHVSRCEENPAEAERDNDLACRRVVEAYGQDARMICISTDKACDPVGVYGRTKAVGEGHFLAGGHTVIRLVNVLGSSGSVLELWHRQITSHQPLTITDPDATRMFMSLAMAVHQIREAIWAPKGGPILTAHDWALVRVGDLARMVCEEMHRPDHPVQVIGLRPGERKHEILHDEPYGAAVL